jgi:hypothetical protein
MSPSSPPPSPPVVVNLMGFLDNHACMVLFCVIHLPDQGEDYISFLYPYPQYLKYSKCSRNTAELNADEMEMSCLLISFRQTPTGSGHT